MEYSAAPNEIKAWLECLAWFSALVFLGVHIYKALKGKPAPAPQPPNESLKLEVEQLKDRITKLEKSSVALWCKLDTDKTEILKAGEDRAVKLHDRINVILSAVSELRGVVSQMNHD
jgi:hypothetical protein